MNAQMALSPALARLTPAHFSKERVCSHRASRNYQSSVSSPGTAWPLIRALSTLDGLNDKTRRCVIGTEIPVLGLRPTRSGFSRTTNRPNEDNLTDSPSIKASANSSKTACTSKADSLRDRPTHRYTASARSTRVTVRDAAGCGACGLFSAANNPGSPAAAMVSDFVILQSW